jgi:diguanylate cyclase (GGDEF)-like protein
MPPSMTSTQPVSPLVTIVRVAIVAVTLGLFVHSTLSAMLGQRDVAVLSALATPLGISAWGFARAGHHEAAIMLLSCVLMTVVTLVLVSSRLGVHDVFITAYGGIVLVAALLLSRRYFAVITAVTVLASGTAFYLEIAGHTRNAVASLSQWSQYAVFLLVTAVFATIGRVASESLFGSLGAARLAAVGDAVTGLANRPGFVALASKLVAPGVSATLVHADLEGFRKIRVMVGFDATDRLVIEAGRRLANVATGMLAARVGEHEFALLAQGVEEGQASEDLARKVHEALNFDFSGVAVRCAVGFARYPRDADGLEALMLAAEASLVSAKTAVGERLAGPADRI